MSAGGTRSQRHVRSSLDRLGGHMQIDDLRHRERQRCQVVGHHPLLRDAWLGSARQSSSKLTRRYSSKKAKEYPSFFKYSSSVTSGAVGASSVKRTTSNARSQELRCDLESAESIGIQAASSQAPCTPQCLVQLDSRGLRREPEKSEEEVKVRRRLGVVSELRSVSEAFPMCTYESTDRQSRHHAVSLTRPPSTALSHRL